MSSRRIVVTGASGLVGRYLLGSNIPSGVSILAIVRRASSAVPAGCDAVVSDYSAGSLSRLFRDADTVIHMAAIRPYRQRSSQQDESKLDETVFQAIRMADVKQAVYLSSCSVYGYDISRRPPFFEQDDIFPASEYSKGKAKGEFLAEELNCAGVRVSCLRLAQVLAADEFEGSATSVFVTKAKAGEAIELTVSGRNFREYLYVKDVVSAIWTLVEKGCIPEVFNLGSGFGCSIQELAFKTANVFEAPSPFYRTELNEISGTNLMNSEKFYDAFQWRPSFTIAAALEDIKLDLVK